MNLILFNILFFNMAFASPFWLFKTISEEARVREYPHQKENILNSVMEKMKERFKTAGETLDDFAKDQKVETVGLGRLIFTEQNKPRSVA